MPLNKNDREETLAPMGSDFKSLAPVERSESSIIDQTTKSCFIFLLVMAFAFAFDQRVSEIMYALGYDRNVVSHIWFIRDQYLSLVQSTHDPNLSVDPFHVFELSVFVAIAVNVLRLARCIASPPPAEKARLTLRKQRVSALGYFLTLLVIVPGGFLSSILGMPLFASAASFGLLLTHSPKAFVYIFSAVFASSCFLCVDGMLILYGLKFGKRAENSRI